MSNTASWLDRYFLPEVTPPLVNASTGNLNSVSTVDLDGNYVSSIAMTGAAPVVRGLDNPSPGRRIHLIAHGGALVLANQHTSATDVQRIVTGTGADVTIAQGASAWLVYNSQANRWSLSSGSSGGGGGGSVPTGTGFVHITSGSQDGAAKLVENADVHASAGIVPTKLSLPDANGKVLKRVSGANAYDYPTFGTLVDAAGSNKDDFAAVDGSGNPVEIIRCQANVNWRGIAGGWPGRRILLVSDGAVLLEISHEQGTSVAANRIITETGLTRASHLKDRNSFLLEYDGNASRWRLIGEAYTYLGGDTTTPAVYGTLPGANVGSGIAVSKLSPGADGQVLTTVSGNTAWAAASGGGSPGGNNDEVQVKNGSAFAGATNVKAGSNYVSIMASPAAAGNLRVAGGFTLVSNVGGVDRPVLEASTAAGITIGGFNAGDCGAIINRISAGGTYYVQINGASKATVDESRMNVGVPLAGFGLASLPFRFDVAPITKSDATDLTLSATQAERPVLHITGTPGGAFNIIGPSTAYAFFIVVNATASACTIKRSGGTGVTIAANKAAQVWDNGSDYIRLTPDA